MQERFLKGVDVIAILYSLFILREVYKKMTQVDEKFDPLYLWFTFMMGTICLGYSTLHLVGLTPGTAYRSAYSFWYERSIASQRTLLDELYGNFNALGPEEQAKLVKAGLAEEDAKGYIYLKFMCPILLSQLICDPVILIVEDKKEGVAIECHDRKTMRKCFEAPGKDNLSPSTLRKIIAFDPKDNDDANAMRASYQRYIKELTNKLNELAPLKNVVHLKNA